LRSTRAVKDTLLAAWRLLRVTVAAWIEDDAPSMGAALAFYAVFSLAPLLLIVIAVAGWVFGEEAARTEIVRQLGSLIGTQHVPTLDAVAQAANRPGQGLGAATLGLFTLLLGATTVFAELESAIDRIWHAPKRRSNGWWALLRTRLLSLGLVLALGFLLIVSLVASAALAAFGRWWGSWFGEWLILVQMLNFAVSFVFISVFFAMIYKWLPQVRLSWRDVALGAAMTALLFTLGKTLIGWYIGQSGVASPFGAAASVVVLLVWVYYSAQIFLLGAEFTSAFSRRFGSLRGRAPDTPAKSAMSSAAPGSSSPATD
jgi:membrane protein